MKAHEHRETKLHELLIRALFQQLHLSERDPVDWASEMSQT